jgi:cytochrome c553/WD40 repeat protein
MFRRTGITQKLIFIAALSLALSTRADSAPDAPGLYQQHCASCHGSERMGGLGPALLPGNLERLRASAAQAVITQGRPASQMPAFGAQLSEAELTALTEYIYAPSDKDLSWTEHDIGASRIDHVDPRTLSDKPTFAADPMNLFIVVEAGDHHATLLDGDTFEPITRFKTRFALHGGPKYSPDGRFVYFASRDGWITKYDIYNLTPVAEVRAGINTRNIAVSHDGRFVMAANYLPHTLVLFDARDLSLIKLMPVSNGQQSSRVSAVYTAPPRHSFIAALKDLNEVWEISYAGVRGERDVRIRSLPVATLLDDFFFDQEYRHLVGASRSARGGVVIDLDSGKSVADIPISGMPHLGSGITWETQGRTVLATPNLAESTLTFIDTRDWKTIKTLTTGGPGFFMRSHENTPYVWTDVFFGPNRDLMHVIDKDSLEIVHTLKPRPGKTAAHVEFTKDGRFALVSIWEDDGELIVYDAKTFEEVKTLKMRKPSGKYNVHNKIHYSSGTSH